MKEIFKKIEECRKCETIRGYKKFPIESHGNLEPFAILVSEAPGKESLSNNKYWVGAGGKILRDCLPYGNELEDIFYLTDIVKCWPNDNSKNRKPKESEIENCSHFLKEEINKTRPKVILSFGGTSSAFFFNREVKITKEHGKITQYNDETKIITLLHPSGIDRFMNRRLYKLQIALLFAKIKDHDLSNIDEIFENNSEVELPKTIALKTKSEITSQQFKKGSFTIPSAGNSITPLDVSKNQIRVTVDFMDFFSSKSSDVIILHQQATYEAKFYYRLNKSHILKLGSKLAKRIKLKAGMRIKMTALAKNKFRIESA